MSALASGLEVSFINRLATQLATDLNCEAAAKHLWNQFMDDLVLQGFVPEGPTATLLSMSSAATPHHAVKRHATRGQLRDPATGTSLDIELMLCVHGAKGPNAGWFVTFDAHIAALNGAGGASLCYASLANQGWSLDTPTAVSLVEVHLDGDDNVLNTAEDVDFVAFSRNAATLLSQVLSA